MNSFQFNHGFWYSGFDGKYFAELLPSHSTYWFIAVLGQGNLISAAQPYPESYIWQFLSQHSFHFSQAVWTNAPVDPFVQNPFLAKLPAHQAIAFCQTGFHHPPISPESNLAQTFSYNRIQPPPKPEKSQIYFILTADRTLLKIGISKNPQISLRTLQKNQAQALLLLGFMPGTAKQVQQIQANFADALLQNEWFRYSPELEQYIAALI
jgi:hypothetical protein